MNHTLSDSQLEEMIKSAVNSSAPLPPDEKFSQLISALRELQERRKADSEPVAEVVSIYGDPEAFGEREIRPLVGIQQMPYGTKLYRHAQPVPVVPVTDAMAYAFHHALTDSPLGDDDVEDIKAGLRAALVNGFNSQPAPVVPEKCPAEIHDLIASHSDALFNDDDAQEIWNGCRAAMLNGGNS
nr:MAG TPA: hypothetical protein [Caudoviricetes sp.]